ncbi:MAG: T9SS type A sorting domain-containing protein [Candidatus Krumholzibacteriota bacterium]|nr:T9SS type A sorting domain-containing protein [Candidatus Krumholzibacteriota bacterium]
MRKALVIVLSVCLVAAFVGTVSARDIDRSGTRMMKTLNDNDSYEAIDLGARGLETSAALDTVCLAWYGFETMDWMGWTRSDNTEQVETFFHVDDFAGIAPGANGHLIPLAGTKSMWCGTRAWDDPRSDAPYTYLCGWETVPGYGNGWNQLLTTDAFPINGVVSLAYTAYYDVEGGDFDYVLVEFDAGAGNWVELANYQGAADTVAVDQFVNPTANTKLRFHVIADGAWSDQDGLWDTDGAFIVDEITVSDVGTTINYENWEDEALDAKTANGGFWYGAPEAAFGKFSALWSGLVDKDPCGVNLATQIVFFQGSAYPSTDYPGLFETPFCTGPGGHSAPCQDEDVISPIIDMTMYSSAKNEVQDLLIPDLATMGGIMLEATVYGDLPSDNLVYYIFGIRTIIDGCPLGWKDRNYVYYADNQAYNQPFWLIGDLYEGNGSDPIQIRMGCVDMVPYWYPDEGSGAAHTPAPWIDNIRIYRYKTSGPQWTHRNLDIFQDTFPSQGTGGWEKQTGRVDCANDLMPGENPSIDPGDSAVVGVSSSMAGGLRLVSNGLGQMTEEVYCYVKAEYVGPLTGGQAPVSPIVGPQIADPSVPDTLAYGWYVSDDGLWNKMLCARARTGSGAVAADKFMIDLNDSLFVRGFEIEYYFEATDLLDETTVYPPTAQEATGHRFEMAILPTQNSGILYVDDFHGRGTFDGTVQLYFDPAFAAVIPGGVMPDRYDVNNPTSFLSNGLGARATLEILLATYEKIVWDCGNLEAGTISDGDMSYSDKSNDCQMLYDWMDFKPQDEKANLWVLGEGVAQDLNGSTAQIALDLMLACGVQFVHQSYYEYTGGGAAGGVITPLVTGIDIYSGLTYYAFGGCPTINGWDVLSATGTGVACLELEKKNVTDPQSYVGIRNQFTNSAGGVARTSWIGHSFMYVRNGDGGTLARNELMLKTWEFFLNGVSDDITGDTPTPLVNSLGQNYPNPFNPSTQIKFSIANKGHVSLKVYNVAGQLVNTLTNEVWDAGLHTIDWNGTNDLGSSVASGVYFYKLKADDFESTKKMILLR